MVQETARELTPCCVRKTRRRKASHLPSARLRHVGVAGRRDPDRPRWVQYMI